MHKTVEISGPIISFFALTDFSEPLRQFCGAVIANTRLGTRRMLFEAVVAERKPTALARIPKLEEAELDVARETLG